MYIGSIFKTNKYFAIRIPSESTLNVSVRDKVVLVPVSDSVITLVNLSKLDDPGKKFLKSLVLYNDNLPDIFKDVIGGENDE